MNWCLRQCMPVKQPFTTQRCYSDRGAPRRSVRHHVVAALQENDIGVHSMVFVGGWTKDEAVKAISGAKKAGYDLIELNLSIPQAVDAKMTASVLEDHDLKASGSLGLSPGSDISSDDAEVRAKGRDTLLAAIQILKTVGGKYFVGVNYGAIAKYPEACTRQQWNNAVNVLKEVTARAADAGITYGLEVINRYESNILNTALQGVEMVEAIGGSNVVVHLDTYHMNIEEFSMEQAVATAGRHLGYVHIGESHRGYLGTGSVDFPGLFRALAASGYSGPLTFESFSSEVVNPALVQHLVCLAEPVERFGRFGDKG
eukprot:jgi/Botrbrau1/14133/Bobra.182_3s0074.1